MITELDTTVFNLRNRFFFKRGDKVPITLFDKLLERNDQRIFDCNSAFGKYEREKIFQEKNFCFEFRVLSNGEFIEVLYQTKELIDDGDFNGVGFRLPAPTAENSSKPEPEPV